MPRPIPQNEVFSAPLSAPPLLIDVRAETAGFARDMAQMRSQLDTTLLPGFERAGQMLERGLLGAIRNGKLGFEDLRGMALSIMAEIAASAVRSGIGQLAASIGGGGGGGGGGGSALGSIGSMIASLLLGAPGRATGGPVSPGRAYQVGERGPELFVPTAAGRVEPANARSARPRDVRIAINLHGSAGVAAPESLQRSARQVARAVRRALNEA